jgi:PAB-dependent poly(A)-specific ribonuclease subunit 3
MVRESGATAAMLPESGVPLDPAHPPRLFPLRRALPSFFMSPALRQELAQHNRALVTRLTPEDPLFHELPFSLHNDHYHSVTPVPHDRPRAQEELKLTSSLFKAVSSRDGLNYAVRRVQGFRGKMEAVTAALQPWVPLFT